MACEWEAAGWNGVTRGSGKEKRGYLSPGDLRISVHVAPRNALNAQHGRHLHAVGTLEKSRLHHDRLALLDCPLLQRGRHPRHLDVRCLQGTQHCGRWR